MKVWPRGARKLEDSRIVNLLLTGPFLQALGLLRPDFPRKCVASPFRNEILWVVWLRCGLPSGRWYMLFAAEGY